MTSRLLPLALAVALLLVPVSPVHGEPAAAHRSDHLRPALPMPRQDAVGTFTGMDGLTYDSAPLALPGLSGELFYGPDFDLACGLGDRLETAMDSLAKVARIIARSGRRVVYTVGPDKTSVLPETIDPSTLPQGACDQIGLQEQREILDQYRDPAYLPMRARLAHHGLPTYFKTDLHWTTIGGALFARTLAGRLDPRLGRIQRYTYGTTTGLGGLAAALHIDQPETSQTAAPDSGVTVRPAPGTPDWAVADNIFDHSWISSPARKTWRGRSLLLGDSFMAVALENLRPIFHRGRFMWLGHVDLDKVLHAIKKSDTVVFESIQVFLTSFPIAAKSFRRKLRHALR